MHHSKQHPYSINVVARACRSGGNSRRPLAWPVSAAGHRGRARDRAERAHAKGCPWPAAKVVLGCYGIRATRPIPATTSRRPAWSAPGRRNILPRDTKEDKNGMDNCIDRRRDNRAARNDSLVGSEMRRYRYSEKRKIAPGRESAAMTLEGGAACLASQRSHFHCIRSRSLAGVRIKPGTPSIQPSTCATARSGGVRSGLRKAARLPSWSTRESQAAML